MSKHFKCCDAFAAGLSDPASAYAQTEMRAKEIESERK